MDNQNTETTDHHLISQFKSGSTKAMETIVERYGSAVFNFGLKMCGHKQDAEDIAQDTFLSAFRYLDGFREETKLRNWLFKIAARACLRKRRKKKCEPEHEISLESFVHNDGSEKKYEIPDLTENPSDRVLRAEMKQIIDAAIQTLPTKYRLVFNLRDIEGFSTQETAEILDITVQTVKTRLHRARLFLREMISDHYEEVKAQ